MTITRSFYRFATLLLLCAFAWAGVASAQQASSGKADAPAAKDAVATGGHRMPAKSAGPKTPHAQVAKAPSDNRAASERVKPGDKESERHYQPLQRNLIGQYQNAVTPPPVDEGR
jgi:hypothetical protein